jgi:hypothetical protein
MTIETFLDHAHSESLMDCHLGDGKVQCAGAAIYRANVCKSTRHPETIMELPADPALVFTTPMEFTAHHSIGLIVRIDSPRPCNYAVWEWSRPSRKWLMRGRFATPQAAAEVAGKTMIVIDVVGDTQVWWRGAWCQRAKPAAIPTLPIQKYNLTDSKYDDSNNVPQV